MLRTILGFLGATAIGLVLSYSVPTAASPKNPASCPQYCTTETARCTASCAAKPNAAACMQSCQSRGSRCAARC